MLEEVRTPELRFKGFSEAWGERKLGELFNESDTRSSDLEILSVSVSNGIYPASESDRDINPGASLANYKVVHIGDVVYNSMRMWQGAVDSSLYDGIVSPAYVVARPTESVYPRFFARLLKKPELLSCYKRISQGNSKDTQTLKFEQFAGIDVLIPNDLREQLNIAAMFDNLDSFIALNEQKHEKLVQTKKAMLSKMFPKPGECVPELRFKGFTDPWQQRKLGKFITLSTEKNSKLFYDVNDVYSVSWTFGIVNQIDFQGRSYAGADLSKYDVVNHGEIVYTKSPLRDTPFGIIKTNHLDTGIVSQLYAVFKPNENCDSNFVETYFGQTARLNNYLRPLVNKGAKNTMNISDTESLDGYVVFPTKAEQKAIGSFFSNLDSLITLAAKKVDVLKNIKRAMLAKMFV